MGYVVVCCCVMVVDDAISVAVVVKLWFVVGVSVVM